MSKTVNKIIRRLLNPYKLIKAIRIQRNRKKVDRATFDPQLKLYADFLTNDMLHYGYFHDVNVVPSSISIADVEEAQMNYARMFLDNISDKNEIILDIGCGMGGLANMIKSSGCEIEALTPDKAQAEYIQAKYQDIPVIRSKFEEYEFDKKYGTLINAESLQYIKLDVAFKKIDKIIQPGGRWIICDYFRKQSESYEKSGHTLAMFQSKVEEYGWKIQNMNDITANVLPTLKFVYMFGQRFLKPVSDFAMSKIEIKLPGIQYIANDLLDELYNKIIHGMETVNPDKFIKEKQYIFIVLEK